MNICGLDHLVMTVHNIDATCTFYTQVLGMKVIEFGNKRKALSFGRHKINLHQHGNEFAPYAASPTPGALDLCLLSTNTVEQTIRHLHQSGITIIEGPVQRTGATCPVMSVYLRDPDGNLLEIAHSLEDSSCAESSS
jgi:catechol 2,3-dioxygenase-like lactoylglutathione lyase family enzyme